MVFGFAVFPSIPRAFIDGPFMRISISYIPTKPISGADYPRVRWKPIPFTPHHYKGTTVLTSIFSQLSAEYPRHPSIPCAQTARSFYGYDVQWPDMSLLGESNIRLTTRYSFIMWNYAILIELIRSGRVLIFGEFAAVLGVWFATRVFLGCWAR